MVCSLVFSPTGGTAKVARFVSAAFGKVAEYELCVPGPELVCVGFAPDDIVFIGVPSFRGRVPALAAERIAGIAGNGARAVITVVYGNREYDDTLIELYDLVKSAGFNVAAAVTAVAQHSELPQLACGRPDESDRRVLEGFSEKIREKISGNILSGTSVPGNRPHKPDNAVSIPPLPDKSCTGCFLCAVSCPTGAIDAENPAVADREKCISCMKCVSVCGTGARKIPAQTTAFLSKFLENCFNVRREPQLFL